MALTLVSTPDTFRSPEEIAALYELRKNALGEDFARMRRIREVMNGEIILPLPELSKDEAPAVANLAKQGMDQLSKRIASVEPTYYFPSVNPGSKAADGRARDRLRVANGWRWQNKMKRRLSKRARYFLAYASAPVVLKPDSKHKIPRWHVRNPLDTFPGSDAWEDFTPPDCIFSSVHTYGGLLNLYRGNDEAIAAIKSVSKPSTWDYNNDLANLDQKFTLLEYMDEYENSLIILGHSAEDGTPSSYDRTAARIIGAANLTGMCLAVVPGSVHLDKQIGHFDGLIGMYQTQAALMALTVVAQRRSVFPREWLIANPNEEPEVISVPDPALGQPGQLRGGALNTQQLDPSFSAGQVMDRLEYGQRMEAGIPAEFGGMSPTNVRTGRRGAQVIGASIDFTIAEAQDVFAESLYEENRRAMAIDKAFFNTRRTYHIATRSFAGSVTYTPSELWETDVHVVDYPIAGTDMQNLPIEGGQRVAMQTLSREGFMEMDPLIKDPKAEMQRMQREGVQVAFLTGIQQLASMPEGPFQPIHLARLDEKLARGIELYQAVEELQREIQEEQAQIAEDEAAAQPGLSMPGQGVEQHTSIPETDPSMSNLTALLGQLGSAQTAGHYRGQGL